MSERIEEILRGAGLTDRPDEYGDGIHGWRCEHPDRYGRCECFAELVDALAEHDRQVAARTRQEVLNALPLPDEDARSGMIHARGLIAAHIIEKEGAGR